MPRGVRLRRCGNWPIRNRIWLLAIFCTWLVGFGSNLVGVIIYLFFFFFLPQSNERKIKPNRRTQKLQTDES